MSFAATKREDYVKKGVLKILITLADTSGDSPAFQLPDAVSLTLQAEGTFASGSVKLQGSNDGTNWHDVPGTAPTLTSAGLASCTAAQLGFLHYRLDLSGGGNTTSVTCTVVARLRSAGTP